MQSSSGLENPREGRRHFWVVVTSTMISYDPGNPRGLGHPPSVTILLMWKTCITGVPILCWPLREGRVVLRQSSTHKFLTQESQRSALRQSSTHRNTRQRNPRDQPLCLSSTHRNPWQRNPRYQPLRQSSSHRNPQNRNPRDQPLLHSSTDINPETGISETNHYVTVGQT